MSDNISSLTRTSYRGSEETYKHIRDQIAERYGEEEATHYEPLFNCRSHHSWQQLGYIVKRGEKAFHMVTIIETKDEAGNVIKKYPRSIPLFYYLQTEPIKK